MLEQINECPVCSSANIEFFLKVKDFSITQESFSLSRCKICGLIFTNPRPDENSIGKYYESDDYISHSNTNRGIINKIYQIVRNYSLKKKVSLINKYSFSDKTILDIGAGTGSFINAALQNGWKASGIEPNKSARDIAFKEYGIIIKDENELKAFPYQSFQIITMWHVLEHVHQLKNRIKDLSFLLKRGGYAIIAVPNLKSNDFKYYNETWAALDVPRHLYHFSGENIKLLLQKNNFKYINSIAMKFDSYYVSMLSEKYRNKSISMIRGLVRGFISNIYAHGNPEKYSSVIYIFEKQ